MDRYRSGRWSRREFLGGLVLAGTAGLIGLNPKAASAETPPETTTIRLIYDPDNSSLCYAPVYVAADLLRAEGFTNVRYVKIIKNTNTEPPTLAAGAADMSAVFGPDLIMGVDSGLPVVALAGLHVGCIELVGSERVRTIRDLKGKKVAVSGLGTSEHLFISNVLAYIGMDPRRDVQWVVHEPPESIRLLAEGKVDAFMAFPPSPQQLRARKIGPPGPTIFAARSQHERSLSKRTRQPPSERSARSSRPISSVPSSRSDPPASSWTRSSRWEQTTRRHSRRSRTCATVPCGVNMTRRPRSSSTRCRCGKTASSRAHRSRSLRKALTGASSLS